MRLFMLKDLNSTVAKRGSVFIGLITPDGAIYEVHSKSSRTASIT